MIWLWLVVVLLVLTASLLSMAETAITRISRVRALALREEKHRNADLLVKLTEDPARALNPIFLAVLLVGMGSAFLVAHLADASTGSLGIAIISVVYTLIFFVVVDAMPKTFGVQHTDRVALALAPLVFWLGRLLVWPTRALIGLANILLPGKGLKRGPFVSEEEIRTMAEVGEQEGSIEEGERKLIHSIFEFGDTFVREVMVPRPDVVAIGSDKSLRDVQAMVLEAGFSRIPVFKETLDEVVGVVFAKDVLKALHQGKSDKPLDEITREPHWVPETKKAADLLPQMQREKFHIAMVYDEHGSLSGLVTLEDLLEELVGEIEDEYDPDRLELEVVEEGETWRASGGVAIDDLNEELDVELPDDEWDTVAGLVLAAVGEVPEVGHEVTVDGLSFTTEKVKGRRIEQVLIRRLPATGGEEGAAEHAGGSVDE